MKWTLSLTTYDDIVTSSALLQWCRLHVPLHAAAQVQQYAEYCLNVLSYCKLADTRKSLRDILKRIAAMQRRCSAARCIVQQHAMYVVPASSIDYVCFTRYDSMVIKPFGPYPRKRDSFGSRHQSIEENRQQSAKHSNHLGPEGKHDSSALLAARLPDSVDNPALECP